MALKLKLTKDEFAALADPFKEHYVERNGAFHLDGAADPAEVKQFRDQNITLAKERDTLRERYKDLDPEAARAALAELERRKAGGGDELKQQIEHATKPLHTRLKALEDEKAELLREKQATLFHKTIADAAASAGIIGDHVQDVVSRARTAGFVVVENGVKAMKGDEPLRDDKGEELTLDGWLKTMPGGFFGRTAGSGPGNAGGRGGAVGPVGSVLYDPDPTTFSKHAEKIAKGEITVVRR